MELEPTLDRVVVEPVDLETSTPSGLVLPQVVQSDKPATGRVKAVGPGIVTDTGHTIPVDLGVGDVVVYSKYAGVEVEFDKVTSVVMRAADVLAVLRPSGGEYSDVAPVHDAAAA